MLHTWALVFGLHLWLCGTVPPGPPQAVHIYHVKYNTTFTCKRICWGPGGTMLTKYFSIFCITIKLTLPHVSAYSLYQRNKNLHFSYIFLVYRNMFTDYDVGKIFGATSLATPSRRRVNDAGATNTARKTKNTTLRIHHVLPCRFFCRKFDIFCDYTATSLVYPNAPIEGPHKKQTQ